jgi:DNA-binding NarL/FixJ family response regulator
VLDGYDDIQVVGEAWNGEEAVAAVQHLRPAVVVMDINMPKKNGIEATAEIKARHPEIAVIGLSVNADGDNRDAMLRAGAAVLLTKEAAVERLYSAIQEAVPKG